jgi:2-keto-4-pentenoate hydratase/2-oxohepta-3-ene-1,7-dioic acid hydratase in catechol pathway
VVRPAGCKYLNYEGEVAIVIGRTCRGMPPSQAAGYIAGYTIASDFGLHDFRDTDAGSMLRVKPTSRGRSRCAQATCCCPGRRPTPARSSPATWSTWKSTAWAS